MAIFVKVSLLILLGAFAFGKPSDDEVTTEHATEAEVTTTPTPIRKPNGTAADREKLRHHLFDNYDLKIIPDNVTVKFGLALIRFDVDEEKSNLDGYVWLRYVWTDSRLKFKEEDFNGVNVLLVDSHDIWKPDITLYNSASSEMMKCWPSNALVYPNEVLWVPPCDLSAMCNLTTRYNPYGDQHCHFKFGSWTSSGVDMDLQFYNNKEEIDLSDIWESVNWEVVSTSAKKTEKFYPCCPEPYPDITFNMTIKRRSGGDCSAPHEMKSKLY